MSYILDALRRSQAERERGQVPGLNAQPVPADPAPPARRAAWTLWLAVGLALGLGGAAALLWLRPTVPAAVPRTGVAPLAASTASAPPAAVAAAPVAPVAARPAPLPMVVSAPPPGLASAPPSPAAAPRTEARAVPLAELSADQRRELPPLVLGGAIWSENAAGRFVLVNGQVVREGEAAAPGVTLERIAPKSVLLRWRELRIEVPL